MTLDQLDALIKSGVAVSVTNINGDVAKLKFVSRVRELATASNGCVYDTTELELYSLDSNHVA